MKHDDDTATPEMSPPQAPPQFGPPDPTFEDKRKADMMTALEEANRKEKNAPRTTMFAVIDYRLFTGKKLPADLRPFMHSEQPHTLAPVKRAIVATFKSRADSMMHAIKLNAEWERQEQEAEQAKRDKAKKGGR